MDRVVARAPQNLDAPFPQAFFGEKCLWKGRVPSFYICGETNAKLPSEMRMKSRVTLLLKDDLIFGRVPI